MPGTKDYWVKKLADYANENWADQPTLFAQESILYFPPSGKLLELGAGLSQDSSWFASKGYEVTAADQINIPDKEGITTSVVNLSEPLQFSSSSFDIIYSHLALHYFSEDRTRQLFDEIYDILKPGGIFAFLVNSIHDPEVTEGEEIEMNFRLVNGIEKRYFDLDYVRRLTDKYEVKIFDDKGSSHKDKSKGVANLIRYVGKKP